jgi:hypothetical protein
MWRARSCSLAPASSQHVVAECGASLRLPRTGRYRVPFVALGRPSRVRRDSTRFGPTAPSLGPRLYGRRRPKAPGTLEVETERFSSSDFSCRVRTGRGDCPLPRLRSPPRFLPSSRTKGPFLSPSTLTSDRRPTHRRRPAAVHEQPLQNPRDSEQSPHPRGCGLNSPSAHLRKERSTRFRTGQDRELCAGI